MRRQLLNVLDGKPSRMKASRIEWWSCLDRLRFFDRVVFTDNLVCFMSRVSATAPPKSRVTSLPRNLLGVYEKDGMLMVHISYVSWDFTKCGVVNDHVSAIGGANMTRIR